MNRTFWYVCTHIVDGKEVEGLGSDYNFASSYVRKDKVESLIDFIVNKSYHHKDIVNVYKIPDSLFNKYPSINVLDYPQYKIDIARYRK